MCVPSGAADSSASATLFLIFRAGRLIPNSVLNQPLLHELLMVATTFFGGVALEEEASRLQRRWRLRKLARSRRMSVGTIRLRLFSSFACR